MNYLNISYPHSSFIFDRVYKNYKTAQESATSDGVFVGRYVLIAYCESALSQDQRNKIEGSSNKLNNWSQSEKDYHDNYLEDSSKSYDRHVLRKVFNGENLVYEDIASLNPALSDDSIAVLGVKQDDLLLKINNENSRILSSELNLSYDDKGGAIKLTGVDGKTISEIPVTDFIADGVFERIVINDTNNTLTFYWTNYNIEDNSKEEKSQTINLYDIIDLEEVGKELTWEDLLE